jgi:hypothetical protein
MKFTGALLLVLPAGMFIACASENGTYGDFEKTSQLFLQDDENDKDSGGGIMLLTDATISCSDFSDAVEDDFEGDGESELLEILLGTNSAFGILFYSAEEDAVDSLSEAWTGTYTTRRCMDGPGRRPDRTCREHPLV